MQSSTYFSRGSLLVMRNRYLSYWFQSFSKYKKMQELGSTKSSSENISLSEGLLCQFSQSTEYLIPDFCPELLSVKGQ